MPARLLFPLLLLCVSAPIRAALVLPPHGEVELAGHLALLDMVNTKGNPSIDDVASGRAGAFRLLPGYFAAGVGPRRQAWLRFTLTRGAEAPAHWRLRVLPPFLDHVALYLPDGSGWRRISGGDTQAFSQRPIDDRGMVFPIDMPPQATRTFYVHMTHDGLFNAYFALYTPRALHRTQVTEGWLFGLYFGSMISLILINLLHWITLREALFGEFSLYLVLRVVFFLGMDGLLFQFLFPDSPGLARDTLRVTAGVVVASLAWLLVRLLDMDTLYPRLARLCRALGMVAGLIALTVWIGWFSHLAKLLGLIVLALSSAALVTAVTRVRHGGSRDWLLLTAILVLATGQVLIALPTLGMSFGLVADLYGNQIGSIGVALALHLAVATWVSDVKQARIDSEKTAQEAERTAERAQQARREQADFVAMLLHEIKTPLAEISFATTVLEYLDDGSRRETGKRYDTIHGAVERLDRLMEQSLVRERQGLDETHLLRRPLSLKHLSREVLGRFDRVGGQRLILDAPDEPPVILADPQMLAVALANLLDNAIKYAPQGDIRVELQTEGLVQNLAVSDAGPGLDVESAARAFDRFWRGNTAGGVGGAGLGLYLVRKIAEAHGGSASVESTPTRGSRFVITLPQETP